MVWKDRNKRARPSVAHLDRKAEMKRDPDMEEAEKCGLMTCSHHRVNHGKCVSLRVSQAWDKGRLICYRNRDSGQEPGEVTAEVDRNESSRSV